MQPCCQDEQNLGEELPTEREGFTVRVCKVCGRRHFVLVADTGLVASRGVGMG